MGWGVCGGWGVRAMVMRAMCDKVMDQHGHCNGHEWRTATDGALQRTYMHLRDLHSPLALRSGSRGGVVRCDTARGREWRTRTGGYARVASLRSVSCPSQPLLVLLLALSYPLWILARARWRILFRKIIISKSKGSELEQRARNPAASTRRVEHQHPLGPPAPPSAGNSALGFT